MTVPNIRQNHGSSRMLRQRFRVQFRKNGDIRFVGHADVMRAFEHSLRRTGLPLGMTEGFNIHPRISFPAPLAVGLEGEREVMEFELADWVPLETVTQKLREQLPPGMEAVSVKLAPPTGKAQAEEAEYLIEPWPDAEAPRIAEETVSALLAQPEIWSERKRKDRTKCDNIRPYIREIKVEQDGRLRMRIAVSPAGSARPDEILQALGVSAEDAREKFRILRTDLRLR
jgi:radical SAM-linked protein